MAKLIVLAPSCPFPARDGVQLRLSNLLRRLPSGWQVSVLCFDQVEQLAHEQVSCNSPVRLTRVPAPRRRTGWRGSQLGKLLTPGASLIYGFQSEEMAAQVRAAAADADAVLAVGLQMGQYLPLVPDGIPTALDNYNIESLILKRLAETRTGPKRWYWEAEAWKLRQAERGLLEQAGTVFAISDTDRDGMVALAPRAKVLTVPMAIDLGSFFPPEASVVVPNRFCFVGAFNWHVNEDAAVWLCQQVWPKIKAAIPDAELHLVGRSPSAVVRALCADPSIQATGTVPDVRPHLWESAVTLVPLRYGSGVRTKILEAFAAERPVVSTPIGCEGLPVRDGQHLRVAETADEFAQACVQIVQDAALARALTGAARTLVDDLDRLATERLLTAVSAAFNVPLGVMSSGLNDAEVTCS